MRWDYVPEMLFISPFAPIMARRSARSIAALAPRHRSFGVKTAIV
jgi:hypothetical protein